MASATRVELVGVHGIKHLARAAEVPVLWVIFAQPNPSLAASLAHAKIQPAFQAE